MCIKIDLKHLAVKNAKKLVSYIISKFILYFFDDSKDQDINLLKNAVKKDQQFIVRVRQILRATYKSANAGVISMTNQVTANKDSASKSLNFGNLVEQIKKALKDEGNQNATIILEELEEHERVIVYNEK